MAIIGTKFNIWIFLSIKCLPLKKGLTPLKGFIQALTDFRLPEFKLSLKLSFETQSFKPKKAIKNV